ncbi:MAG: prepilin peptidase [Clostridia bacterium]|nr:prepilin peptidase [Clostridia bacterium]
MIGYIVATALAIFLGQASSHLIRRLSLIVEKDDELKLVFKTLKEGFKVDYICSVINLILFNLLIYFIGPSFSCFIYMITISLLQVVFVIDYKMQLIPDTIQILLGIVGIVNVAYMGILQGFSQVLNFMLAGIIGAGIFLLLGLLGKLIFKKDGMGMGDVKLMAALGLIFGIKEILTITLVSFFISAIFSIILILTKVKELDSYIPFGPFIVIAAVAIMFTGYNLYVDLFIGMCTALSNLINDLMFKIMN